MIASLPVEKPWTHKSEQPSFVPGELMPDEVEDLCEQICGTRDPRCVPARKRFEVAMALLSAKTLVGREIPL